MNSSFTVIWALNRLIDRLKIHRLPFVWLISSVFSQVKMKNIFWLQLLTCVFCCILTAYWSILIRFVMKILISTSHSSVSWDVINTPPSQASCWYLLPLFVSNTGHLLTFQTQVRHWRCSWSQRFSMQETISSWSLFVHMGNVHVVVTGESFHSLPSKTLLYALTSSETKRQRPNVQKQTL